MKRVFVGKKIQVGDMVEIIKMHDNTSELIGVRGKVLQILGNEDLHCLWEDNNEEQPISIESVKKVI